jgi:hypothetical protein
MENTMAKPYTHMVSFHTHSRDPRRDRVTNTVTKLFGSRADAVAWGQAQSPGCFNVYEYDPRNGWVAVQSKTWPASAEKPNA